MANTGDQGGPRLATRAVQGSNCLGVRRRGVSPHRYGVSPTTGLVYRPEVLFIAPIPLFETVAAGVEGGYRGKRRQRKPPQHKPTPSRIALGVGRAVTRDAPQAQQDVTRLLPVQTMPAGHFDCGAWGVPSLPGGVGSALRARSRAGKALPLPVMELASP